MLFDMVLASYNMGDIICPYWFMPDWSNLDQDQLENWYILWSEIWDVFQEVTLNHQLSKERQTLLFSCFFSVFSLLLFIFNTPHPINITEIPNCSFGPRIRHQLSHSVWRLSEGCWKEAPLPRLRGGSETWSWAAVSQAILGFFF